MVKAIANVLVAVLVLTGLPLHVCACGQCDQETTQAAAPSCPHCGDKTPQPKSDRKGPCGCCQWHIQTDMVPVDKTLVDSPIRLGKFVSALATADFDVALVESAAQTAGPQPDRWPGAQSRPIPILLGHLLL